MLSMVSAFSAPAASALNMGGKAFIKTLPGAFLGGVFDPMNLTPECVEDVLVWREAELMHCRVAMMAAAGFLVQEAFHPILPEVGGPAINQLGQVDLGTGLSLLLPIMFLEIARANKGWIEPDFSTPERQQKTVRTLRDGYKPGDLGLDLFGAKPKGAQWETALTGGWADMQNKELNNGRLAMVAVAGMVVQELNTGVGLFGA